jgi:hypothetical protein
MICFNPWTLPSATEFQDYFAGEDYNEPSLGGWLRKGDQGQIKGTLAIEREAGTQRVKDIAQAARRLAAF